jgi:signal transduction histidine kinase
MSLQKKIILSFIISAFVIAILAAFEYINFVEIKKEIQQLELADTVRSKTLQLRRHEKNFFLYGMPKAAEESEAIHNYLKELNSILDINDKNTNLVHLKNLINEYGERFNKIDSSIKSLTEAIEKARSSYARYNKFFPLIELTFMERPDQAAEFLKSVFLLPKDHNLIKGLEELYSEIQALRKNGEDIINISKELDKAAREKAEAVIHTSQIAILVFFPLFLIVGIGVLFIIINNVVNRLKLLIDLVGKTGRGDYYHIPVSSHKDEVGALIREFNDMENQLSEREEELERKNKELLQSKKLAAIGTLASGVAHELNNPLNNIYISAQVLMKEAGDSCSLTARETVNDILGQTIRVKGIVADLLEFGRGKEPQLREISLKEIIMGAYKLVSTTINTEMVNFVINENPAGIKTYADSEQLERVFINLFTNAVDAMGGNGDLAVKIDQNKKVIRIKISDSGKGMPEGDIDKIFEPFYTTKDKGTGLGLAIVFNIIKKHGGEINVQSKEGKGTTFFITLPSGENSNEL